MESHLERAFALWLRQHPAIPPPVCEYRFAPPRRWRFDFAWPERMFAVEIEGGLHIIGRHQRVEGYLADCEKYEAAMLRGWMVYRIPGLWVMENGRIIWRSETLDAIQQMVAGT